MFMCPEKFQADISKQAQQEIINADKAMSDMAAKEGFHKSLLYYADDSVVKPQDGQLPVIGKQSLIKYWANKDETKDITWYPYKAEASKSGEIGYTLGNWKFVAKDTTMYGNYYTIWKKQNESKHNSFHDVSFVLMNFQYSNLKYFPRLLKLHFQRLLIFLCDIKCFCELYYYNLLCNL